MLNLSKIASRVAVFTEPKTCDGCGFPARSSLILNSQGDVSICPMCSDIENFHKTGERELTHCPLCHAENSVKVINGIVDCEECHGSP